MKTTVVFINVESAANIILHFTSKEIIMISVHLTKDNNAYTISQIDDITKIRRHWLTVSRCEFEQLRRRLNYIHHNE